MIDHCVSEIERGPLSSELEFLKQIGALDKRTNGSGTVGAIAALFIASRYATDPWPACALQRNRRGWTPILSRPMAGTLWAGLMGPIG